MLRERARDERHLELLREVGVRSVLLTGLAAGERTIGILALLTADSGRTFSADDTAFAAELGRRIGTAVDNARRFSTRHG